MIPFLFLGYLSMLIFSVLKISKLPPQIPLFYSKPWGEDQLADNWFIIILPVILSLFFFSNQLLINRVFENDDLIKRIVYYFNLFLTAIISFTFIKIILLVT